MQHANKPETADSNNAETHESQDSELDQVSRLLAGDDADKGRKGDDDQARGDVDQDGDAARGDSDGDESEAGAETSEKKGKPKNLNDLAERLGVEVSDLYSLEVPHGANGESFTLGELKDLGAKQGSFEVDRMAWEEAKATKESEFLRSSTELNELLAMLPKSALSKDLVETVQARRRATAEREEERTLAAIPAWEDGDVRASDEKAMNEYLAEYGLPSNYLSHILDHRVRKFVRDSMLRKRRMDEALAKVKTLRKNPHAPTPPPGKKPERTPKGGRRVRGKTQVDQVAALLK